MIEEPDVKKLEEAFQDAVDKSDPNLVSEGIGDHDHIPGHDHDHIFIEGS